MATRAEVLPDPTEHLASGRPSILLVDDLPANLLALEVILRDLGVDLVSVRSGKDALRRVLERPFAAILLDVMMPEMDGFETAKLLRQYEATKLTPIVFITAFSPDDGRTATGYAVGAFDFIYKPISPEVLRSKVAVYVELHRKETRIREQSVAAARLKWEAEQLRKDLENERRLADMSSLFRLFVESVEDYGIFMMDSEGKITSWNAAAKRLFGFDESEVIGQHFSCIFTAEDIANQIPAQEIARAKAEGRAEDVRWHVRKDGTLFWADGVVTALKNPDETLHGFCKLLRDNTKQRNYVSELKLHKAELKRKTDDLGRSNEELKRFAYVASHDLQEPLRMVASYVQLLRRRYQSIFDEEANRFIDLAVSGTRRMRELIDALLEYSKFGSEPAVKIPVDCNAKLAEAISNLKAAIDETGAKIVADNLPTVPAYPTQLVQLFQNLLSNAIKYRREEAPTVHIGVREQGDEWVFSVKDSGIGIEMKYAERIFQVFQRLHPQGKYPGTGIGLPVCMKIVEQHGGRIWVESVPGDGSVFHFTIRK